MKVIDIEKHPSLPSLIFAGKTGAYQSEAHYGLRVKSHKSLGQASELPETRSSLPRYGNDYARKKFNDGGRDGAGTTKTLPIRNLQILQ